MSGTVAVFVYDGDCGFCKKWWLWLRPHLPDDVLGVPFQALEHPERLGISKADLRRSSVLVTLGPHQSYGASGIAGALSRAEGSYRVIGLMLGAPPLSWVANVVYRFVARNRSWLPAPGG